MAYNELKCQAFDFKRQLKTFNLSEADNSTTSQPASKKQKMSSHAMRENNESACIRDHFKTIKSKTVEEKRAERDEIKRQKFATCYSASC